MQRNLILPLPLIPCANKWLLLHSDMILKSTSWRIGAHIPESRPLALKKKRHTWLFFFFKCQGIINNWMFSVGVIEVFQLNSASKAHGFPQCTWAFDDHSWSPVDLLIREYYCPTWCPARDLGEHYELNHNKAHFLWLSDTRCWQTLTVDISVDIASERGSDARAPAPLTGLTGDTFFLFVGPAL